MASEEQRFSIDQVLDTLSDKLVRRHPHVFGEVDAATSGEVLRNWEAIKRQEKAVKSDAGEQAARPLLASVSAAMPALLEAQKISHKVAQVGFDWPSIDGVFAKLAEEREELLHEVAKVPAPGPQPLGRGLAGAREGNIPAGLKQRMQDEIGDLLFTVVNLARFLDVDPELALRHTNRKFRRRFGHVEAALRAEGREVGATPLEELERRWQQAKGED
jgi:uncharacterized protein YabN with tetrapyrrole methylase and pyrophosphatase domain